MSNRDQAIGPRLGRAKLEALPPRTVRDEGGYHHPKCDCAVQTPCSLCNTARELLTALKELAGEFGKGGPCWCGRGWAQLNTDHALHCLKAKAAVEKAQVRK